MNRTPVPRLVALATLLASAQALAQTCPAGNPLVAPDSRYTRSEPVAGQRVVTDTATGLIWKECVEGRTGAGCVGDASATMTWASALAAARSSTWAGYGDWRLPNINELSSLVESGCHSPSINSSYFPNTSTNAIHWSSTTYGPNASFARAAGFGDGAHGAINKTANVELRLVRGGQWLDAFDAALLFADGFEGD